MKNIRKEKARMRIVENVNYQLRDANGKLKSLFAVNKLGRKILEVLRKNYSPYNLDGSLKKGLRAYLALNGLRIPLLTGMWTKSMTVSNLVTNAGMAGVASRINGSGAEAAFTWIGIGTGTTAANVTDTDIETEITTGGGERTDSAVSRTTTDVTDDTATLINTFNFTSTFAVTESGVLNADDGGGVLLCRQVFSAINVVNGDSLQVTWDIDVD